MKKVSKKRLVLSQENVRLLDQERLQIIGGGMSGNSGTVGCSDGCTAGCTDSMAIICHPGSRA